MAEFAELADDLEIWIEDLDEVPDHLTVRIRWWAFRLANTASPQR